MTVFPNLAFSRCTGRQSIYTHWTWWLEMIRVIFQLILVDISLQKEILILTVLDIPFVGIWEHKRHHILSQLGGNKTRYMKDSIKSKFPLVYSISVTAMPSRFHQMPKCYSTKSTFLQDGSVYQTSTIL